jgi:predicted nucleic acid-binding protein
MTLIAIVDSGPLLAAANRSDPDHAECLAAVLRETKYRLVIPAMCVAEVSYFLGRRQSAELEARFLQSLEHFDVRAPVAAEWPRIAERLETETIITLDHRHFGRVKPRHVKRFTLLPAR